MQEDGRVSKLTSALLSHGSQGRGARDCVGLVQLSSIRDQEIKATNVDLGVEVVICHVHPVPGSGVSELGRTLHCARKGDVRWREGRFPELAEFIKEVWYSCLVGIVVQEKNHALLSEDHLGEQRPIFETHWNLRRHIGKSSKTRSLDRSFIQCRIDIITVSKQDSNHVVWMTKHPVINGRQIILHRPGIKKIA